MILVIFLTTVQYNYDTKKAPGHCQERGVGVLRVPMHSII